MIRVALDGGDVVSLETQVTGRRACASTSSSRPREHRGGGGADLLQALAHTYVGPDVTFPPMPDPPPGVRLRVAVERFGGIGPCAVAS